MQRTCFCVLLLLVLAFATPGFTQTGNGAPNGAHYNLNIIGVENPKTDPLTGSDRHTIFVALGNKNSAVTSKIYLTQGDFQVCDGNAFDAAYDCSGNQISGQGGIEGVSRSEEHTSELQSPDHIVCRLLLEKKKKK